MRRRAALLTLSGVIAGQSRAGTAGTGWGSPWKAHDAASSRKVDHADWAGLLARFCRPGGDGINRFAYAEMDDSQRAVLDRYLAMLADTPVSALSRSTQLAFWINLHNALVVRLVLDRYPVASIRDMGVTKGPPADGAWSAKRIKVEGRELSVGEIANDILRALWSDPRINYVMCCGTLGAPNLAATPLEPAHLDRELDGAAIGFVNHPRGVSLVNRRLRVSSLYVWHAREFGGGQHAVIKHLMAYAAPPLALQLRGRWGFDEHDYDWALNDASVDN
ncbi:MAG TPA: DUF547 domain-containing protein [Geminicoccaceae bacterium]|nr:DUF547 domain-containing protein [Geminicoccus sp.]HMU48604.1 DUF547 domain-containing protein [Geminicoccaceae bacterium]